MSRGHGKVERFVLDYLPERRNPAYNMRRLADAYAGIEVDDMRAARSTVESVRRAIKNLAREGLVKTDITSDGSDGLDMPELIAWKVGGRDEAEDG